MGFFRNGISGKLPLTYRTDQIYSAYHLMVRQPDLKKWALANSAESHNNVFAAVNLLRGPAVNATILHVVINAGLVWHKASHQLKYDPWQQCKRIRPHDLKEKKRQSWAKNIAEYPSRPALWGEFLTQSAEHCYNSLLMIFHAAKYFRRRPLFNHFSLSS